MGFSRVDTAAIYHAVNAFTPKLKTWIGIGHLRKVITVRPYCHRDRLFLTDETPLRSESL